MENNVDIAIEEAVLGAFMLEYRKCFEEIETCKPEWFYKEQNRLIFEGINQIHQEGVSTVDLLTVFHKLNGKVPAYDLSQITNKVSSGANVMFHVRILQQLYTDRELRRICAEYSNNQNTDPFETLNEIRSKFETIDIVPGDNTRSLEEIYTIRAEELNRRRQAEIKIIGKPTGFSKLDEFIGGYVPGEFIVIAGRPSMGKTAFAVNLTSSHCHYGGSALMFSIEMPSEQISDRVAAAKTGIDGLKIRAANLDDYDIQRISEAELPPRFFINDNVSNTIDSMAPIIRKYRSIHSISVVVIDYLQLIKSTDKRNREQEIAHISRRCKQIAKENQVCVVALAQLNREADKTEPSLAHLRESGAIEQDADTVLFPYRPEKDNPNKSDTERALLIIAKCRNGKTGTLSMNFHSPTIQYIW